VLLVDASLHLGSCAPMLDLNPQTTLASAAREMARLDETLLKKLTVTHECGLDLLAAPVDAVEAADIDDQAIARVLTLARRSYDWVVVDTFPMLDGLVMAILDLSDRAYVITQNTVPNVVGAARLLPVMEHLGFPRDRTRIVLNNNFERISGGLTPEDAAARMDRDIDFVLPYQKRLVTALNTGRPYVLHATGLFGFAKTIRKLVDELETVGASDDTAPVREERQGGTQPSPAAKQDPLRMNPGPATA
jgi:pilus assembly protein CpaE